jgi:hypothetical protein
MFPFGSRGSYASVEVKQKEERKQRKIEMDRDLEERAISVFFTEQLLPPRSEEEVRVKMEV